MGWRDWRLAVLAALKMRLNLNCPLAFVPGYLVLNWMETEDPFTDTTGMDGSEGEPEGGVEGKVGDKEDGNKKVTAHTYTPHPIVKSHSQGTNTVPVNVSLVPMLFLATTLTV